MKTYDSVPEVEIKPLHMPIEQPIEDVPPPPPPESVVQLLVESLRGSRVRTAVTVFLYAISLIVGLCVMGLVAYRAYAFIDDSIRNYKYDRPGVTRPTPEFLLLDGITPAHRMTFTAPDGAFLHIPELKRDYPILNGQVTLIIADNDWFKQSDIDANVQELAVTLSPILTTNTAQKIPLPPVTYSAMLAAAPVTLIRPGSGRDSVAFSIYTLRIRVLAQSTVLINGNDVSDLINQDGILTANMPIAPIGENPISILVNAPGYRENRTDVSIFRAKMATSIELDTNTASTSSKETMTIRGTTLPGADFDVLSPFDESSLKYDPSTGAFSFSAIFKKIGDNSVTLIAQMPGQPDSFVDFKVTYIPNIDDYSRRAWKMDYNDLVTNPPLRIGTVYAFDAQVIRRVEGSLYIVDLGAGQLLYLENAVANSSLLDEGGVYRFYADLTNADDIYPYLAARYIYMSRASINAGG